MRILFILITCISAKVVFAQTTIPAGNVYGTWKKTGSPYKVTGNIVVPKDSTLRIEKGVKVEFQGSYSLEVKGSVQAIGAPADTISFTAANKTTGWGGIELRKNLSRKDSLLFNYCKFEYVSFFLISIKSHGAIFADSVTKLRISNSLFQYNKSNVGGGIRSTRSTCLIENCRFYRNKAMSHISTTPGVSGSAISSAFSNMFINGCWFEENSAFNQLSSTDSAKAEGRGILYTAGDDTFQLTNSTLIGNSASGSHGIDISLDTDITSLFLVRGCNFYNNSSKNGVLISVNSPDAATKGKLIFDNLHFDGNRSLDKYGYGSHFSTWDGKYELNRIKITSNVGRSDAIEARNMVITNSYITGINGIAIYNLQNSTKISNSIIVNNLAGVVSYDGGEVAVVNSIVAYNGTKTTVSNSYQGGIVKGSVGAPRVHVVNSIVQGNRVAGRMYNITTTSGTVINTVKNSVVEGGLDSARSITNNAQLAFGINTNNIFDTVSFIKPPKGVGAAFADTTCDFRVRNTCDFTSKTLNAGLNANGFISPNPSTDFYGNPRIQCKTIDIGPYELEGSKQSVSIDTEPTDQAICPKTTAIIAPTACGASLSYQWQQSSNGTTFSNISGANSVSYSLQPTDSGYYRLIITQTECNKKDTSRAAKIAFKAGGKMSLVANAKDSTLCSKQPIVLQATVNNANSYQWQESNNGTAFSNISGATSNPYNTIANSTQWYRLIAKNALCNYSDTFPAAKVTANPLPTPNLGADASIPNTGNKVLNPGTFNAYAWSTGATTPTLTVDKNNLTAGANAISVQVTGANGCKASDTVVITLELANSLQDPSVAGIRIYPNPASDHLTIAFPESATTAGVYHLSTMDGRILQTGNLQPQLQLNLSNLTAGTYFLSLDIDGVRYGVKVVK